MKLQSPAILTAVLATLAAVQAQEVHVTIQADQVLHPLSRYLTGACLEDVNHEVYGGLYSQMIFGESFQEPPVTSPLQGFKSYGGTWRVEGKELHFTGTPGDKLVSELAPFEDGEVGVEVFLASANCLQPDGQNDNGWDQGLLFLNPSQVWLQPPGYVTQMFSRTRLAQVVRCNVGANNHSPLPLDAAATRSADGKTLVLQTVNPTDKPVTAQVHLAAFAPTQPMARMIELSAPLDAVNTAGKPDTIVPRQMTWPHGVKDGSLTYNTFPPHSVLVIAFE